MESPSCVRDFLLPNALTHKEAETNGKSSESASSETSLPAFAPHRPCQETELEDDVRNPHSDSEDSEKSLCDFLPPQVRALNASRYLNELGLVETPREAIPKFTGAHLQMPTYDFPSPSARSLNHLSHRERCERQVSAEESQNVRDETASDSSLCDFLSPRVRALNDKLGHDQSRNTTCEDIASEASLCDFLSPRVRALNDPYFGGLLEDAGIFENDHSLVPPSHQYFSGLDAASLPRASTSKADQAWNIAASDYETELLGSCTDVGISSEMSLCDFLPPRVVALNRGLAASEGPLSNWESQVALCDLARRRAESNHRKISEKETSGSDSEASLCDDVPYVAMASKCAIARNFSAASSCNLPGLPVHSSSIGQHVGSRLWSHDELRRPRDSPHLESTSGYPQASAMVAIPDDILVDTNAGDKSDTSLPDFRSHHIVRHGEALYSDHVYRHDESRTSATYQSEQSLCDFLPSHALAFEETPHGSEMQNSLVDTAVDGENGARPERRRRRRRSESSILRALRGVRESFAFRSWRRRSTVPASMNHSDTPEANDREVLHLPTTLPVNRTPTTTISVETFRKEILYPRQVCSRTTVQTFSCSGQWSEDSSDCESCAVCLESFSEGDVLRIFPCSHRFHTVCIDAWLVENRLCPMCRHDPLALTTQQASL